MYVRKNSDETCFFPLYLHYTDRLRSTLRNIGRSLFLFFLAKRHAFCTFFQDTLTNHQEWKKKEEIVGCGMSVPLIVAILFCCWPCSVSVYSWPVPACPPCQSGHACVLARPHLSAALSIQRDYRWPTPPPVSGAHMNQCFLRGRKRSLPTGQCHTATQCRP